MKKMKYNQPTTEVMDLKTTSLMQDLVVSFGNGGGGGSTPPPVGAPRRGEIIP